MSKLLSKIGGAVVGLLALATFLAPATASATFLVPQGGTGIISATAHGVLIGNGANGFNVTAPGTAGQVLTSNGASADPTFQPATGGGSSSFPFTPTLNFGSVANATSTPIWFKSGIQASSTSQFDTVNVAGTFIGNSGSFTGALSADSISSAHIQPTNITNALFFVSTSHQPGAYTGTTCTNQFVRSLAGTGVATCNSVSLTTDITGILAIANGGTGTSTAPSYGKLLVGDANGNYELMSTSSLNIAGTGGSSFGYPFPSNATTSILTFSNGATLGNSVTLSGITGSTQCLHVSTTGVISGTGADCKTGTVTSVGLTLPTGFSVTGSPVTTTGTLSASLIGGYTLKKTTSYIVAAAGGDFTTIQAAVTQCGADGGGNIYLTDSVYNLGGTGVTFRGSNCAIWGAANGTTTINITGATTAFKTNSAAGQYTHDEIHHVLVLGDGNVGSIAFDFSDMTHSVIDGTETGAVGTSLRLNDTQNVTFYNAFTNDDWNDNRAFCINASSTNPVNANNFENIFCGAPANGGTGIQLNNANGNQFTLVYLEPASVTGTKGIVIFDNTLATNNGVFNNKFDSVYDEANGTGVQISNSVNANGGGIRNNTFNNFVNESNTTDWNVGSNIVAQNNFEGDIDSNFSNPITSLAAPVGIGTSTALQQISTQPFAYFGISPSAGVAKNEFVIGSSTGTSLIVNNSGFVGINTTNPLTNFVVNGTASTTALTISSISGSTQCLHVSSTGVVSGTGSDCGTGSGGVTSVAATYPLITSGSTGAITLSTGLSTTTQNFWSLFNSFTSLFATNASSTNATTTNLALIGAASNCNGTSALTTNSSGVVGCTAQPQGTVTAVSVATSNGFSGSSSGGATPILTLATSITGLLKGNGTAISAAAYTDFPTISSGTFLANGTGATAAPTAVSTSTIFGAVQPGKVLGGINGVIGYIATTTDTCSTGVTCAFSAGNNAFSISNGAITNAMLANSQISGVSLGGTLGALTATNATLTFSGSYTGASAQTVGINLANPNSWTGLQQFANATSTLFSSTYASSTNAYYGTLNIPGLGTPAGAFLAVDPTGKVIATTTPTGGGLSFGYPFPSNATTSALTLGGLTLSNITGSTQCLHVNSSGLISGTGTDCGSSGGSVTGVTGTYPILSSGGTSPVISTAFGTTTANTFSSTQTFTVSPVFSTLGAGTVNSTSGGSIYSTATSSVSAGSGISFGGTAGALTGGSALTISVSGLTTANFTSANISQWTNDSGYLTSATGVTTVKQSFGTTQSGAIVLATSSAATSNGVTVGQTITNSGGTFTFNPTVSVSAIPNGALANSTISGVSLGGTLAALTATNATLTFSGSYTGTAGQTIGLNLANPNSWTGLQQFTNASSTLFSASYASSTAAFFGTLNLPGLTGTQCLHEISGVVSGTGSDCGAGGGGVTSVGLALPTGFTVTNSPVTTSGTLTAAFGTGYGIKKPYTWVVAASGGDFTTIQAALNACGTAGGGSILLTDSVYNDGATALQFTGSNCNVYGASGVGTTTINFTGATTLFNSNTPAGYTHNGLHNLLLIGDGNVGSVAINWGNQTHGDVSDIETGAVGTSLSLAATTDTTFYNRFERLDFNDNRAFCINASSTNAVNGNVFDTIFCGAPANGGTGINLDNENGNSFNNIYLEPASVTGTIGLSIFDNKMTLNGGVWNNSFTNFYVEANGTGVKVAVSSPGAAGNGIQRNTFENFINEANTTDYNIGTVAISQNTFINAMDSNFSDPINTFQQPFGIGTSTRLQAIGNTPYAAFGVAANNSVSTKEFVVANTSNREDFSITNAGNAIFNNTLSVLTHFITVISATFTPASEGEIGIDTTDSQMKFFSNGAVRVLSPNSEASFTYATTTAWTGTTTIQLAPAYYAQTWNGIKCSTNTGTVQVSLLNAGSRMNWLNASTTVGTVTLTTNNNIAAGALRSVDIGTPLSSPTNVSCTITKTINAT